MNTKYYIKKSGWGLLMWGIGFYHTLYSRKWDELTGREQVFFILSSVNCLLFPIAWFVLEKAGMRYTPNFWQNQIVNERTAAKFFSVLMPVICFLLAIPLAIIAPFIKNKKKAR